MSPRTHCCRQCGAPLSPRTLEGLCPPCTARLTFGLPGERDWGAAPPPAPVLSFGDYELLQEIGRGGMGVVYRARQRSLDRVVALKMILSGRFASGPDVERFKAEAQAAAALRHPNIVAVHEIGEIDGQRYFTMDYVEGGNLEQAISDSRFSLYDPKRAARWARLLAEAIQHAHERGVLHRDLKSSNVLIDDHDQPRITDFGLAKRLNDASDLTVSGRAIGSPSFMPPEQALGLRHAIGPRSDVYALGALLYYLLTARPPFAAETVEATLTQVLQSDPVSPRELNPSVPRDLETICLKCLEKEPSRRYQTARQLADELSRFLANEPILARPATPTEKLWRWAARNPKVAGLAASLLLVFAAGFAGVLWQWRRAELHAQSETRQRRHLQELLTDKELQEAEGLFAADDASSALARLARGLRQDPANPIAATRLVSALTSRSFALPVAVPLKHPGAVLSAEFSPDGQRVVTGAADGSVRVWNVSTGLLLQDRPRHADRVRHAIFSPEGDRILSASEDGTARVWDAHSGQPLTPPLRHAGKVRRVHFSPDGRRVVTASADATARIWDAQSGQPVGPPLRHAEYVIEADFSPDGKRVVTCSDDRTAAVWEAETGQRLAGPLPHGGSVLTAQFSLDGRRVLTASADATARVWDAFSGRPVTPPLQHQAGVTFADFSPDGTKVVTASSDHTARLWDATTGATLARPLRFDANVLRVEFSPDGRRVLAISDTAARVWDAQTGEPVTESLLHEAVLEHIAGFSPDGGNAVTTSLDKTAIVWDVRPGSAQPREFKGAHADYGLAVAPDGQKVAVGTAGTSDVLVWDVANGERTAGPLRHPSGVNWFEFSPDGHYLVTACRDGTARVWDAHSGQLAMPLVGHRAGVVRARYSPEGRRIVTASEDDTTRIWDVVSGLELTKPLPHQDNVAWAEFSPDGRKVATASADRTARVWDATTGELLTTLLGHELPVLNAQFSPDRRRLLTFSLDATARIWDVETGRPTGRVLPHRGPVLWAEFSADGEWIVTASADKTACVWDAATGQPQARPLLHKAPLCVARFSTDGRRVVTLSEEGIARIWDTVTGHLLVEPLRHHATPSETSDARFLPDGHRLATVTPDGVPRLWDVPILPLPSPDWLPDLAEAVAGKRFDAQGRSFSVNASHLVQLRQRLGADTANDFYARWARWFFADRHARALSPFTPFTIPEPTRHQATHRPQPGPGPHSSPRF